MEDGLAGWLTVDEVECHGEGTAQSAEAQGVDFGVDQVLDGVPTKRPARNTSKVSIRCSLVIRRRRCCQHF